MFGQHSSEILKYAQLALQLLILPSAFLYRAFQEHRLSRSLTGIRLRVSHYAIASYLIMAAAAVLFFFSLITGPSMRSVLYSGLVPLVAAAIYLPIRGQIELKRHEKMLRHKAIAPGPGVSIRNSRLKGKKVKSSH